MKTIFLIILCSVPIWAQKPTLRESIIKQSILQNPLLLKEEFILQNPLFVKNKKSFWRPYGPGFVISFTGCLGTSLADVLISRSKVQSGLAREANPLFSRSDGSFRTEVAIGVTIGTCLPILLFQRGQKAKGADIGGFIASGIHGVLAVHAASIH